MDDVTQPRGHGPRADRLRPYEANSKYPLVDLEVSETDEFPKSSVFGSLDESSAFFESGCVGYSSRPNSPTLDGLHLKVLDWQVSPLQIHHARSSFFDNMELFPAGTITLDHALLMRNIVHEWHSEPELKTNDPS